MEKEENISEYLGKLVSLSLKGAGELLGGWAVGRI